MKFVNLAICTAFIFCFVCSTEAAAQTTEFTYQGSLNDQGGQANGSFDFEFKLFHTLEGATQQGPTLAKPGVMVNGGIFSVNLDFGDQFPGSDRFLEIAVKKTGAGAYNLLLPRQKIGTSPYAIKSLVADISVTSVNATNAVNAQNADQATNALQLDGVSADQFVHISDPRLSDARNPLPDSPIYIQNRDDEQPDSRFHISGTGKASVFEASLHFNQNGKRLLGTGDSNTNLFAGLDAGSANAAGTHNSFFGWSAGNVNTDGTNNSFFGAQAGDSNLLGDANSFFGNAAGKLNSSGSGNSFMGNGSGNFNTTGMENTFVGNGTGQTQTVGLRNTLIGYFADTGANNLEAATALGAYSRANQPNSTAIGAYSQVDQSNALVLGSINGVNGAPADTKVGIGTTTPLERLHVVGNSIISGNLTVNGALIASIPSNSTSYIHNRTDQQSASNFNISGNGTAGGTLSANAINSQTQFNINGTSVLSISEAGFNTFAGQASGAGVTSGTNNAYFGRNVGVSNATGSFNSLFGAFAGGAGNYGFYNSFFGESAGGSNSTGGFQNSFFGYKAGFTNTTGHSNTAVGNFADVGSGNLIYATAIGANAVVSTHNTIMLGRALDRVVAPGNMIVGDPITQRGQLNLISSAGNFNLYMQGGASTVGVNLATAASGANNPALFISHYNGTTYTDRLVITPSGTVQVLYMGTAGATTVCRNASNELATCSSSLRYKTNVSPLTMGMDIVRRLQPISFDWKGAGVHDLGLGAEEVAEVAPLLVTLGSDGVVEGVKYDRLNAVLINALKEQQVQLDSGQEKLQIQQQEIRNLQARTDRQEMELVALRAWVCSVIEDANMCSH